MQRQWFIFSIKIKNMDVGTRKIIFFRYIVSEIPNFSYMDFFRKCLKFCQSIPLNSMKVSLQFC